MASYMGHVTFSSRWPRTQSSNSVVDDVFASEATWQGKSAKAAGEAPSVDEDWLDNLIEECAAPFSAMVAEINSRQSNRVDANS